MTDRTNSTFGRMAREAPVGLFVLGEDGLRTANRRFTRLCGRDRNALLDTAIWTELFVEADGESLERTADLVRSGSVESRSAETRLRTDEREEIPVWLHLQRLEDEEAPLLQGTVVDTSAWKRQEEELLRAKRGAEELGRLKSSLLANLGHEFRTPLATIRGFAEILAEEVPEHLEDLVTMIRQSGGRLQDTLSAILDLSELESGFKKPDLQRVDVSRRVREIAASFEAEARGRDLHLGTDVPVGDLEAETDPSSVYTIVSHLLQNAIKFTEEGEITLRVRGSEDRFRIEVTDTGPGMSEEFLPRAWEPFTQESTGLDRSHEGIGMGLAIVRQLTELLNGKVDLTSAPGRGTTVAVELPRRGGPT